MFATRTMRTGLTVGIVALLTGVVSTLALGQGATVPVMIQGSVVGQDGQPAQRPVLVYAPSVGEVAMARSGTDGRFEVRLSPSGELARAVGSNGGAVTLRVEVASDSERVPQAVTRVWKPGGWQGAEQPVTLQDTTPSARLARRP